MAIIRSLSGSLKIGWNQFINWQGTMRKRLRKKLHLGEFQELREVFYKAVISSYIQLSDFPGLE